MSEIKSKNTPIPLKGRTTKIQASSRASIKIKDSFYTFEYLEERNIPNVKDVNLEAEKDNLWDTCNEQVDKQISDIVESLK